MTKKKELLSSYCVLLLFNDIKYLVDVSPLTLTSVCGILVSLKEPWADLSAMIDKLVLSSTAPFSYLNHKRNYCCYLVLIPLKMSLN